MAKVTQITIGMQRKYMHPFVQYESFQIEGSVTADLSDGESPEEAREALFPVLREQMVSTYQKFRPKKP